MSRKRKVLSAVTRQTLLEIAYELELTGLTGKTKAEIVDTMARSRRASIGDILELLTRDELKSACRKLGLDDTGRAKQLLIDRLLNGNARGSQKVTEVNRMGKRKKRNTADGTLFTVDDYRHTDAKRKNNPPAKLAAEGTVPVMPKIEYAYNPRRAPVLRFDSTGQADKLAELVEKAKRQPLATKEAEILAAALSNHEPWLEWASKREQDQRATFQVDPVALHIHERISAQAILKIAARKNVERTLFGDPELDYHEAVQFYQHEVDWTNRLILGDSLQVMASLAHREDLAGKVQMIYIDPPYGIKFASNFQPQIGRRDVKDKETDLTREPEMVKAYRDTWHLGIHSYLSYLRDRLIVARELLADTGSIFVQIGDENVHRVRDLLDAVFQPENFVAIITLKKTAGLSKGLMPEVTDFILWYARNKTHVKRHTLFVPKVFEQDSAYRLREDVSGAHVPVTDTDNDTGDLAECVLRYQILLAAGRTPSCVYSISAFGRNYDPTAGRSWSTNQEGMIRLLKAERVIQAGATLNYLRYGRDNPTNLLQNLWADTASGSGMQKTYVVQTNTKVIERCMLMTTDPGDLVLDPTCGSGTTAYVAEQWGRRWITIDTSRVAIAIARQRLLTARFERYRVKGEDESGNGNADHRPGVDPHPGFVYKTVPHITLRSIAQNTNLDPIFEKHEPILDEKLAACNKALKQVTKTLRQKLEEKLGEKQKREGKRSITDADRRRYLLPPDNRGTSAERKKKQKDYTVDLESPGWYHWEVPFDTEPDWPKALQASVTEYRKAWRAKMDEVNACIAANADQEELVDQPEIIRGVTRVTGPFTVEAVQPPELSLGDVVGEVSGLFDGEPEAMDKTFQVRMVKPRTDLEVKNIEAYLDQMTRLLRMDGVRFPDNKQMRFSRLDRVAGTSAGIHAEGRWVPDGEEDDDPDGEALVAVAFGPQYGPVTAMQVEELLRATSRRGYTDLVVAGFSFDGPAQELIDSDPNPKVRIHRAHIRPDVNPAMEGLLKEQPGSQLFTVFGQPRTTVEGPNEEGEYVIRMEGVDIYNPVTNTISSTGADKVAAWFLDGDYDGRTFCITQAFFPDRSAWDKLKRALGGKNGVIDDDAFEAFSGTESLPFPAGKHKCVAVKVIDPRGNEVMQVHRLEI